MKRILIISAHPDDEILGCGATIARLVKEGYEAYTLILGEGITSRDEKRDRQKRKKEIIDLKKHIKKANDLIGVKKIFSYDFPDNRFDTVPILDIVKVIENIKKEVNPKIIFTHYKDDLNIDHNITYKAVLIATRPLNNETVKEIYSFEVLSSTEWNFNVTFNPNIFFSVNETINIKENAMSEYKSELREYPHPRSIDGIKLYAKIRGLQVGMKYAEAFECVRIIK